jgi:hypothetical protein
MHFDASLQPPPMSPVMSSPMSSVVNTPAVPDDAGPERIDPVTSSRIGSITYNRCYTLCYISVPCVDLSQPLTISVRPDRLTAVYRTHFGRCRYLDTQQSLSISVSIAHLPLTFLFRLCFPHSCCLSSSTFLHSTLQV